jgi:MFS family permease
VTSLTGVDLGTGASAYLRLLRYPPAARPFLAAMLARLPISMAPLGILLLVQEARGAYAVAGLVTGAFAVGMAVGTPFWGRLMDRVGQVRVLVPTSLTSGALVIVLAAATLLGAPVWALVGLAAAAGLAYPPMSPAMRAAWRVIFVDVDSRRVAFALDGTAIELVFVGGPLILSGLLAFTPAAVPLVVTAACMIAGGLLYCRTAAARSWRPVPSDQIPGTRSWRERTALTVPGVAVVLLVMLALSIGFGQLDTSLAATAGKVLGGSDRVGILFTAIAGGSAIGGLVLGSRTWRFSERQAVPVLFGCFGTLLGVLAVLINVGATSLWVLLPVLFVTGLSIAPTLIMQQALLDHLTPSHRLNEAQGFLSASNTTGAAIGTALAGVVIDYLGIGWSFGGAAVFAGCAAVVALASQNHWRTASEQVTRELEHSPR